VAPPARNADARSTIGQPAPREASASTIAIREGKFMSMNVRI
jgi:hypothetical protein